MCMVFLKSYNLWDQFYYSLPFYRWGNRGTLTGSHLPKAHSWQVAEMGSEARSSYPDAVTPALEEWSLCFISVLIVGALSNPSTCPFLLWKVELRECAAEAHRGQGSLWWRGVNCPMVGRSMRLNQLTWVNMRHPVNYWLPWNSEVICQLPSLPALPKGNRIMWKDRFKVWFGHVKPVCPWASVLTSMNFNSHLWSKDNSLSLWENIIGIKGNATYLKVPNTMLGYKCLSFCRIAE